MRFLFYTHSLVSDWNHGNAHFLRGVMTELVEAGHAARALEPLDGWSRSHLRSTQGSAAEERFSRDFPMLRSREYGPDHPHEAEIEAADVVIVHEWTDPRVVGRIGIARRRGGRFLLLFHDTHHRAVSDSRSIAALPLEDFDGILAFGEALAERYRRAGWGRRVFTWHEAADTRLFRPLPEVTPEHDLVWIGNWGDGERSREIDEFLLRPAARLGLAGTIHGVRYPEHALDAISRTGLRFRGWLANAEVPEVFARHRVTVHIPRRPYVESLPGIPTIRVFEALACGIPLVCAPWDDAEGLFRPGRDFLLAPTPAAMEAAIATLLADTDRARQQAAEGLETLLARHTCAHRARELLVIARKLGSPMDLSPPTPEPTP